MRLLAAVRVDLRVAAGERVLLVLARLAFPRLLADFVSVTLSLLVNHAH